jgi:hypothetical protein
MKSIEISGHALFCNDRLIFCSQGCGMKMKEEFLENHLLFLCQNKNFKYQRAVDCPNGCGEKMMKRDVVINFFSVINKLFLLLGY